MIAIVVIAMQITWAYLGFYVGNAVRYFVESNFGNVNRLPAMEVRYIPLLLQSDDFSTAGILANSAAVVISRWLAFKGKSTDGLATLLAVPGYVWGFLGLVGADLNGATLLIDDSYEFFTWPEVAFMFTFGAVGALYVMATKFVLSGPSWIRSISSPNAR